MDILQNVPVTRLTGKKKKKKWLAQLWLTVAEAHHHLEAIRPCIGGE